jgi:mgtE-like transporter
MIYCWKTIVKHSIPLLTLMIVIEIVAGQILQGNQNILIAFPIFFISIPVINSVGGNLGSVLGARLASGLHVGYIEYTLKDKNMQENVVTTLVMGLFTYFILAIVIYYVALLGGVQVGISLMEFVSIILCVGILLILIICLASVLTAFWSFKKGLDPDDMVAPVVTTLADTTGIVFLFVFIGVVGLW